MTDDAVQKGNAPSGVQEGRMSALRGRVHKRDYILPSGGRYVAWVAEVYPTNPDPRVKVDAAVYRAFWDNHSEALADVTSYLEVAA